MKKQYKATAYRQSKSITSPWIVSFVAPAEELLEWVGIPRRTEKGLVGFQRLDDEVRVGRAKEFFTNPDNQSPTALILGIHETPTGKESKVKLDFLSTEGNIRPCVLEVDFNPENISDIEIKERIKDQIKYRLEKERELNINSEEEEEEDIEEDTTNDEDETPENQIRGGEIELGRSLLNDLLIKLDDDSWFKANKEALLDYAKPATLIDGQHRIKGAELNERGIPFTVCALFNCPWPEQVFQFTIVNYTQNGIPDQFITANAALSLTKNELGNLNTRLSQAQVKVIEYDLMRVVNFDPRSPFYQLIDLSAKKNSDRIGYKTMVKMSKQWWSGKNFGVVQIIDNLYPDITGKKSEVKTKKIKRWQESGDWGDFFIAFWDEVHNFYKSEKSHISGAKLWEVGKSNLMIAVVLSVLQDTYLTNLSDQDEEFFTPKSTDTKAELIQKIRDRAKRILPWFEPEFFGKEWKVKSLNTGIGKQYLESCFDALKKSKGKFVYANSSLVTGKTE